MRPVLPAAALAALAALAMAAPALPARAEGSLAADLVRDLSRCDRSFFEALADNFMAAARIGLLRARRDYAYFRVKNRRVPGRTTVLFAEPQHVGKIVLDGYYDYILDIQPGWTDISWGFLAQSTIADARAAVAPLAWDSERFRLESGTAVRTEVWALSKPLQGWEKIATDMSAPAPGAVQRAFSIRPMLADPSHVAIGCTLQGRVPSSMLQGLRPDVAP